MPVYVEHLRIKHLGGKSRKEQSLQTKSDECEAADVLLLNSYRDLIDQPMTDLRKHSYMHKILHTRIMKKDQLVSAIVGHYQSCHKDSIAASVSQELMEDKTLSQKLQHNTPLTCFFGGEGQM